MNPGRITFLQNCSPPESAVHKKSPAQHMKVPCEGRFFERGSTLLAAGSALRTTENTPVVFRVVINSRASTTMAATLFMMITESPGLIGASPRWSSLIRSAGLLTGCPSLWLLEKATLLINDLRLRMLKRPQHHMGLKTYLFYLIETEL